MVSIVELFEIAPKYNININHAIDNRFLIHDHKAVRAGQHWDLRLGYNGVLESFASKKIPDLIDDNVKRIIIFQQPQHDSSWFDFEGEISDGYGAGKVSIWDKGTFKVIKWTPTLITLDFAGKKIKGQYSFVLYKENQWLMFKSKSFERFI
jgi:DNA ligase D-like protein (predicted 3'-phosphoesterase)